VRDGGAGFAAEHPGDFIHALFAGDFG